MLLKGKDINYSDLHFNNHLELIIQHVEKKQIEYWQTFE